MLCQSILHHFSDDRQKMDQDCFDVKNKNSRDEAETFDGAPGTT